MGGADADLARRAWRAMSEIMYDHDRKVAVSEALGLSFARVRALRLLGTQPHTLRALAERLLADPPYVTLMVDDLEGRGLVQRMPHPEDSPPPAAPPPRAPTRSWTSRRPRFAMRRPRTSRPCCACWSAWPAERRAQRRASKSTGRAAKEGCAGRSNERTRRCRGSPAMELGGLEPPTSWVRSRRSPN
jgi:hypothetical protein